MRNYVWFLISIGFCFFPCCSRLNMNAKQAAANSSLAAVPVDNGEEISASDIDGYYINRNFNVWKIYTQDDIIYMEHFASHARYTNEIFKVTEKSLENGFLTLRLAGTPKPNNPNPGRWLNCVVYKKDNNFYLDESDLNETKIIITNEFRRENINFEENADMFEKMQVISLFYRASRYSENTIYVITPKYPVMEIAAIGLDDDFIVQNIDIGSIEYEDGMLYAHFSDKKLSVENDIINNTGMVDLYSGSGVTRDVNYPNIGGGLAMLKQNFDNITIKTMDFDVNDIIDEFNGSILVRFRGDNYIIKNGHIIDEAPRGGEVTFLEIIKQDNDITIINYKSTKRNDDSKSINFEITYKK